jgi:hypothetical protein
MSALSVFVPLLKSQFGCMIASGILMYWVSAYAKSAKVASRVQAIAFLAFTAGAVMVVKGIAEAYQR